MPNKPLLASISLINENSLQLVFAKNWYQEDINALTTLILNSFEDHQVIETISGADREYCRFEWQKNYFIINFECYSESCWIEHETTPNIALLNSIKQCLDLHL